MLVFHLLSLVLVHLPEPVEKSSISHCTDLLLTMFALQPLKIHSPSPLHRRQFIIFTITTLILFLFPSLFHSERRLGCLTNLFHNMVVVWHSGSALVSINEVNLRRARLLLGWVTVSGFFNSRCRTFISVCNQPPRPTQPSILPGSVNEDQLRLGRQRQVWFIPF